MSNHRTQDGGIAPLGRADPHDAATLRDGMRAALPLVLPALLVGASFGVAARTLGWGVWEPVVMSIVVFSGSAQFASTGVLAAGGGLGAAIGAATLANLRFLPLGLLTAPATRGTAARRALEGQLTIDASVILATDEHGRVSRGLLFGATIVQAAAWVGGTALGAAAGIGSDGGELGVDVVFPAFFLYLLFAEVRGPGSYTVAAAGGLIALALIPLTPAGVPVVAATLAAALGMRRR